jgi:hypothetical protein
MQVMIQVRWALFRIMVRLIPTMHSEGQPVNGRWPLRLSWYTENHSPGAPYVDFIHLKLRIKNQHP